MNSKFRGTLLGVLIGDCCGAVFEGEVLDAGQKFVLRKFINKLEGVSFTAPRQKYTDDTAMTKSVARCLLKYDEKSYQKNLAVDFVKEYCSSTTSRGYGDGVQRLLVTLRKEKFEDLLGPARNQFNGTGSFGNGAAMRISPVSLYCVNKSDDFLFDLVGKTSEITHANVIGINGAILQALAIREVLKLESDDLDVNNYVTNLLESFKKIEKGEDEFGIHEQKFYTEQLEGMRKLLNKEILPSDEEVVNILGHSVNALYSVPTAIYCFLRNVNLLKGNREKLFRSTLEYAICLGGDTDTIASMACSLVGAFTGDSIIAKNLIKHCESSEEIIELSDKLYEIVFSEIFKKDLHLNDEKMN
ncbi:CLUMA_CG005535, isoform A [Clunio marinus]|uniref:ADP-ribosylhydrolase ARH3 n=1 Tax=Clunio marinus TaxID=568069 RepID=A0A1J1HX36_9DIPT|nr:CLUMA_CG005535, isoform A [Clunio marinus]